jgi:hypothetical protein
LRIGRAPKNHQRYQNQQNYINPKNKSQFYHPIQIRGQMPTSDL